MFPPNTAVTAQRSHFVSETLKNVFRAWSRQFSSFLKKNITKKLRAKFFLPFVKVFEGFNNTQTIKKLLYKKKSFTSHLVPSKTVHDAQKVQPCKNVWSVLHHWHLMPQFSIQLQGPVFMFLCRDMIFFFLSLILTWTKYSTHTTTDFPKKPNYSVQLTAEQSQVINGLNLPFLHSTHCKTQAYFWPAARGVPVWESRCPAWYECV